MNSLAVLRRLALRSLFSGLLVWSGGLTPASGAADADKGEPLVPAGATAITQSLFLSGDLDFGSVVVGTKAKRTLTLYNASGSKIRIKKITYPNGFRGSKPPDRVPAGGTRTVDVTFAPDLATTYTGSLTVITGQSGVTAAHPCSGTGIAADAVDTPTFSPDGGAYAGTPVMVTISCTTTGATIHFTTDGSEPTKLSPIAAEGSPVYVFPPRTLKARAWKQQMDPSDLISAEYTPVTPPITIFQDDFEDNLLDGNKWTTYGQSVKEDGQIMQVLTTVMDHPGTLYSRRFSIFGTGPIMITRDVFLHRDLSRYYNGNNHYFQGYFAIYVGSLPGFSVDYQDYDWQTASSLPRHGFFISRNNAWPNNPRQADDVSPAMPAVWDTWFFERIIYDPISGDADYFVNDIPQGTFNVGALPTALGQTMNIEFQAYGWWIVHQQLFDNLVVTQEY